MMDRFDAIAINLIVDPSVYEYEFIKKGALAQALRDAVAEQKEKDAVIVEHAVSWLEHEDPSIGECHLDWLSQHLAIALVIREQDDITGAAV